MTSPTCDHEWPFDATLEDSTLHRCCEKAGHTDWHMCRCTARKDADQ